jgi:fermentation-respiration switch protein FrsA (DUF1100 family)
LNRRLGAALLAAVLLVAACGGSDDDGPRERVEAGPGGFGVGYVSTPLDLGPTIGQPVPTTVWYPAQVPMGQPSRLGAAAAVRDGPFPLVVFVHGAGNSAATYVALIEAIASRGYVVAAPSFPESSSPQIIGSDRAQELAEPQALALPALVERVRSAGMGGVPIGSIIDPDQLHLVGHSLGAATVLTAAYNSCCLLPDVTSVTAMSALLLPASGDYDIDGSPLLLIHGEDDDVVPVATAESIYDQAAAPRFLLRLAGEGHYEYTQPNSPSFGALVLAVSSMLEGNSGGRPADEGLAAIDESSDIVSLQSDP